MTDEEKQEFYYAIKSQIRITDYAKELGFTVVRRGRYFSLLEHDSVIIDPEKNCFWRNSRAGNGNSIGMGGSIIDFAIEFGYYSLSEAITLLGNRILSSGITPGRERTEKPVDKKKKEKVLVLPKKADNMKRVFAYLIKSRCIAGEVVQELVNRHQLYQDNYGNCVFLSFNEKDVPVFACVRGTCTHKPFYGDVEGCDYKRCFFIDNQASRMYITESVIDALSVMTLKILEQNTWNYLVLGGVGKTEAVEIYLDNPDLKEIWIGTDNDKWGMEAAKILTERIERKRSDISIVKDIPKEAKDWNAVLQKRRREAQ